MTALLVIGVALIVVVVVDAILTVLHPTRRGPLAFLAGRGTWSVTRRAALGLGRPALLSGAGAAAMCAIFAAWVLLLWIGFALVYLPNTDLLAYTPSVDYGDHDLFEALYLSGMSLTTVGFGDVVGETDALRLVTVAEAATGFGIFTAAVTYLLSVYPRVSTVRAAARAVQTQAHDATKAARMVASELHLASVQTNLIEIDEDTERFPVLYYFHSQDPGASLYGFLRGATMLCLQARWGVSPGAVGHARRYGEELQSSLERTAAHYAMRFLRGGGPDAFDRPLEDEDARRRLRHLADAAGEDGAPEVTGDADTVAEFARFTGRCEQLLRHLAENHGHEFVPVAVPQDSGG